MFDHSMPGWVMIAVRWCHSTGCFLWYVPVLLIQSRFSIILVVVHCSGWSACLFIVALSISVLTVPFHCLVHSVVVVHLEYLFCIWYIAYLHCCISNFPFTVIYYHWWNSVCSFTIREYTYKPTLVMHWLQIIQSHVFVEVMVLTILIQCLLLHLFILLLVSDKFWLYVMTFRYISMHWLTLREYSYIPVIHSDDSLLMKADFIYYFDGKLYIVLHCFISLFVMVYLIPCCSLFRYICLFYPGWFHSMTISCSE